MKEDLQWKTLLLIIAENFLCLDRLILYDHPFQSFEQRSN